MIFLTGCVFILITLGSYKEIGPIPLICATVFTIAAMICETWNKEDH